MSPSKSGIAKVSHSLLNRLCGVFVLLFIVAWPALALADEVKPTALAQLTEQIMMVLTPVLVAAVGTLASWLLWKIKQKTGLQVSDATAKQWEDLARNAALRGAEWARKKAKGATDGKKLPGPEVMEVSATWALEVAKATGLPEKSRAAVEGLIESQLYKLRAEMGAGSTVEKI